MRCPNKNCQVDNPDGATYCKQCGTKLEILQKCPFINCDAKNIPEIAKYCPKCGRPLANKDGIIELFNEGIMLIQELKRSDQWKKIVQHYSSNEILTNYFKTEIFNQLSSLEVIAQSETSKNISQLVDMVLVKSGNFKMGNDSGSSDERPVHLVCLSSFYIGRYLVTQQLWQQVMGNNPSSYKGENLPVDNISWFDCISFCNKLSVLEGFEECYSINGDHVSILPDKHGYRLPTEAEWEYAARGGTNRNTFIYSGSNSLKEVGWYVENSNLGIKSFLPQKSHPVGSLKPNELGIYDMSGNVCEWCWDWYEVYSYKISTNPSGPNNGSSRIYRGGRWSDSATKCRISYRNCTSPSGRNDYVGIGLRLVYVAK